MTEREAADIIDDFLHNNFDRCSNEVITAGMLLKTAVVELELYRINDINFRDRENNS